MEHEPQYNHTLDGYGLFLAIHTLCELEEMVKHINPDASVRDFCAGFTGHTEEYFQDLDRRIRADFMPLADHPELLALDIPMQMVYVRKNPDALLIQSDILLILLTKSVPESGFIEKIQEQTGLKFRNL